MLFFFLFLFYTKLRSRNRYKPCNLCRPNIAGAFMMSDHDLHSWLLKQFIFYRLYGASVAEWLRSLTLNHLPLTAVGSNPDRDFGFFHVGKLSS
jgi:hypothetical protein